MTLKEQRALVEEEMSRKRGLLDLSEMMQYDNRTILLVFAGWC